MSYASSVGLGSSGGDWHFAWYWNGSSWEPYGWAPFALGGWWRTLRELCRAFADHLNVTSMPNWYIAIWSDAKQAHLGVMTVEEWGKTYCSKVPLMGIGGPPVSYMKFGSGQRARSNSVFSGMRGFGQGLTPAACEEGEEWDWNAMACVTAGQAVTPSPPMQPIDTKLPTVPVPTIPPVVIQQPAPAPPPAPPPPAATDYTPWIIGGAAVVGVLALFTIATR